MKTCSKCLNEKELVNFTKDRTKKDGLSVHCRECKIKYKKDNFEHLPKINSGLFKVPWEETEKILLEFPEVKWNVYYLK